MTVTKEASLLHLFQTKINEAISYVPRMTAAEKLKAVQFWNVVSEKLQDIVNDCAADINAVALKMGANESEKISEIKDAEVNAVPQSHISDFITLPHFEICGGTNQKYQSVDIGSAQLMAHPASVLSVPESSKNATRNNIQNISQFNGILNSSDKNFTNYIATENITQSNCNIQFPNSLIMTSISNKLVPVVNNNIGNLKECLTQGTYQAYQIFKNTNSVTTNVNSIFSPVFPCSSKTNFKILEENKTKFSPFKRSTLEDVTVKSPKKVKYNKVKSPEFIETSSDSSNDKTAKTSIVEDAIVTSPEKLKCDKTKSPVFVETSNESSNDESAKPSTLEDAIVKSTKNLKHSKTKYLAFAETSSESSNSEFTVNSEYISEPSILEEAIVMSTKKLKCDKTSFPAFIETSSSNNSSIRNSTEKNVKCKMKFQCDENNPDKFENVTGKSVKKLKCDIKESPTFIEITSESSNDKFVKHSVVEDIISEKKLGCNKKKNPVRFESANLKSGRKLKYEKMRSLAFVVTSSESSNDKPPAKHPEVKDVKSKKKIKYDKSSIKISNNTVGLKSSFDTVASQAKVSDSSDTELLADSSVPNAEDSDSSNTETLADTCVSNAEESDSNHTELVSDTAVLKAEESDSNQIKTFADASTSKAEESNSSHAEPHLSFIVSNTEEIPTKNKIGFHLVESSFEVSCKDCNKQFPTDAALAVHTKQEHTKTYACLVCKATFSSNGNLNVHMRKHTGEKPYSCNQCAASFTTKGNLQRHMKTHTGEKPFKCDDCGGTFTEKKSLIVHMRRHTGEKPYECKVCRKRFSQTGVLQSHMHMHLNQKPHLCEHCGKSFRQRSQLRVHKQRHNNVKRFKCADCDSKFLTKGDFERHMRTHTGERPFTCEMCSRSFTRQQSLNEHLNRHYGLRPYKCKYCSKAFAEMSACYKHMKMHEKEKIQSDSPKSSEVETSNQTSEVKDDETSTIDIQETTSTVDMTDTSSSVNIEEANSIINTQEDGTAINVQPTSSAINAYQIIRICRAGDMQPITEENSSKEHVVTETQQTLTSFIENFFTLI